MPSINRKDQKGDKTRSRKTIILFLGDNISRGSIAFFVCFWSVVCAYFWAFEPKASLLVFLSASVVVSRVIFKDSPKEDAKTWRWWCFWHTLLYIFPLLAITEASIA